MSLYCISFKRIVNISVCFWHFNFNVRCCNIMYLITVVAKEQKLFLPIYKMILNYLGVTGNKNQNTTPASLPSSQVPQSVGRLPRGTSLLKCRQTVPRMEASLLSLHTTTPVITGSSTNSYLEPSPIPCHHTQSSCTHIHGAPPWPSCLAPFPPHNLPFLDYATGGPCWPWAEWIRSFFLVHLLEFVSGVNKCTCHSGTCALPGLSMAISSAHWESPETEGLGCSFPASLCLLHPSMRALLTWLSLPLMHTITLEPLFHPLILSLPWGYRNSINTGIPHSASVSHQASIYRPDQKLEVHYVLVVLFFI